MKTSIRLSAAGLAAWLAAAGWTRAGDAPAPRFAVGADTNTVVDARTGLMWARHADLRGTNLLTWEEAVAFCRGLDYGGHRDWRLPHIRELTGLMNTNYTRPMLANAAGTGKWTEGDPFWRVQEYGKEGVCYYWATTTTAGEPAGAWLISFFDGRISPDGESAGRGHVWPVRTVQQGAAPGR